MKKILSLVLILAMVLGMLAACGEQPTNPTQPGASLEDAKTYLAAFYKEDEGTVVRRDFSLIAVVMIDGVSFPITWTTDSPNYVTLGAVENNTVKVDIVEEPAEQVTFKLTGTLTDAEGKTASVTITRVIEAAKATGVEFVAAPAAGTAYKFAVQQNNLGQTIYFTGEMSGFYLATSANPFDAVDVFVEEVDGGARLYFMKGEVKTYIDVVPRGADQPGKVNVVLTETPAAVYTWDAERKTYVTTVEGNDWYLGCYNTYNTISASNTSYIENVEVIGDTQFPAGLAIVNIVASQVASPVVDTAYKFAVVQNTLGQTIYFTGEMSGYYLATSVNPAEGVNVFVENAEGGVRLYFMKGEVKTYIDVVPRGADQPGKVNVILTEEPTAVYTWDAERRTYTTVVEENTWYLGCYSSYNTISASNISYIENVEVIGDTQFPAGPYTVEGFMELQPEFGEEPVEDPTEPTTAPTTAPTEPATDPTEPSEPVEDPTEPSEPVEDPTEPSEPVEDPTEPAEPNVLRVKIYYPDSQLYVTAAPADRDRLKADTEATVWTVEIDENGYYIFIYEGKYMTSGATGNSLSMADTLTDCARWEVIACAGGVYLRNVGANYNGNYNQYMEYYYDFTTYGFNETKANIYTFQLVEVE